MSKKIIVGVVTGVAIVSVASLLLSKNSKYNWKSLSKSAGNVLDGIKDRINGSDSDGNLEATSSRGQLLARRARQHAAHTLSQSK